MLPFAAVSRSQSRAPVPAAFRIEHRRAAVRKDGGFVPAAALVVLPVLRTSGLLAALPGEETKTLLTLLTFLTPNGRIEPTLPQMAEALRVPEKEAGGRLLRLLTRDWQGLGPLVREAPRGEGERRHQVYRPASYLLEHADAAPPPAPIRAPAPDATVAAVAFSRAEYSRPREEVEREIIGRMGKADEYGDSPEAEARRKLGAYGVPADLAGELVARFGTERALKQASWMAYRSARNPAALLVAAIECDYGEPPALLRARGSRQGLGTGVAPDREVPPADSEASQGGEAAPDMSEAAQEPPLPDAELTIPTPTVD